ncbi:MAG TPA: phosphatidylserine/phosphatidylglycerophosphate/cardiolipin synthase family protein [Candidatus Angelobacter sp.]|nr:phosphatidylserine/phosphatidylglycerophosphate/cardiolipin synthase family protein [Candidatus Angelobacter sp.]
MPTQTKEIPARHKKGKEGEIAREFERHRWLRWFAIVSMLAIASWVLIALFGPVPSYTLDGALPADLASPAFMHELEALSGSALEPHTHIQELPNGVVFYEAELKAISAAQKSIDWEAYIFQKGKIAQRIVDALTARARAGVAVNLVLDGVGSLSTPKEFFTPLQRAGGHVSWYHPVRFYNWPRDNNRTHRELIVIDGDTAFVGGAGVSDKWWHGEKKDPPWRDTMFEITGDAVRALQGTFAENWLEASGKILAGDKYFSNSANQNGAYSMVVDSSPTKGGSTRARILFQTLIASAKKSIDITTPYFLPDESLRNEMVRAMRERHVRVRILVPGKHSDHAMTRSSSEGTYGDLLKAGAEIYEYEPAMIHAKLMVVDGEWNVIGSTNFDHRSFGLNDEVSVAALDPALAEKIEADFEKDLTDARHITLAQWQQRGPWERGMEWVGWVVAREQ